MDVKPTTIEGVRLIEQKVFKDHRGSFEEIWNDSHIDLSFRQTNSSKSHRGVLRGMHIQRRNPQGKMLRVLEGQIWDAWVDLRPLSQTFGMWDFHVLDSRVPEQLYIPPGLAHGFLVLSAHCTVLYHCTELFDPSSDGGIHWNDPEVGIRWPIPIDRCPILSQKDAHLPRLRDYVKRLG